MATEVVTCPRCSATHPEDEPHACGPSRVNSGGSTAVWPLRLAGFMLWLLGGAAAYMWFALQEDGYTHWSVETALAVFAIMCLGLGGWTAVRRWR